MKTNKFIQSILTGALVLLSIIVNAQTQNRVAKFDAGSNPVNSQIFDDGTNVGAGTVTPSFKFTFIHGTDHGNNFVPDDCIGSSTPMPDAAIGLYSSSSTGGGTNVGVQGVGTDDNSLNVGGHFKAKGSWTSGSGCFMNAGVFGGASGSGLSPDTADWIINFGVTGSAHGQNAIDIGGYFTARNQNCTGLSVGVYTEANNGSEGIAGLYAAAFNDSMCTLDTIDYPIPGGPYDALLAAFFEGNTFTSGLSLSPSDARLKQNISDFENASDLLSKLQVKSYTYNQSEYSSMQLPAGKHFGVIAQQVEEVFPELVFNLKTPNPPRGDNSKRQSYNIKAVNYQEFIPLLIAAHKEQGKEVQELKNEIVTLRQDLKKICEEGCGKVNFNNTIDQGYYLNTFPNPTGNNVQVSYSVKGGAEGVAIELCDASGKLLQAESFGTQGSGSSTFDVSQLPAGNYFITLKSNGVVLQTNTISVAR